MLQAAAAAVALMCYCWLLTIQPCSTRTGGDIITIHACRQTMVNYNAVTCEMLLKRLVQLLMLLTVCQALSVARAAVQRLHAPACSPLQLMPAAAYALVYLQTKVLQYI